MVKWEEEDVTRRTGWSNLMMFGKKSSPFISSEARQALATVACDFAYGLTRAWRKKCVNGQSSTCRRMKSLWDLRGFDFDIFIARKMISQLISSKIEIFLFSYKHLFYSTITCYKNDLRISFAVHCQKEGRWELLINVILGRNQTLVHWILSQMCYRWAIPHPPRPLF